VEQYGKLYPLKENNVASAKQLALMYIQDELEQNSASVPKSLREPGKRAFLLSAFQAAQKTSPFYTNTSHGKLPIDGIDSYVLTGIVQNIAWYANINGCSEFIEYFMNKLDECYEKIESENYSSMQTYNVLNEIIGSMNK